MVRYGQFVGVGRHSSLELLEIADHLHGPLKSMCVHITNTYRQTDRIRDRERGLNVDRYTPLCVCTRRNHMHAKTKNYIQNTHTCIHTFKPHAYTEHKATYKQIPNPPKHTNTSSGGERTRHWPIEDLELWGQSQSCDATQWCRLV